MGSAHINETHALGDKEPAKDRDDEHHEQEVDIWWGAYNSRAMLPSFALCVLLSAIVALLAAYVWRRYDLPPLAVRYSAYAVIGIIWLAQIARWIYRVLTKTYRLTTRRLYIERTFLYSPFVVVDLSNVTDVRVEQSAFQRRLRVGRIRVYVQGQDRPISLDGIYRVGDLAIEFRRLVQEGRERNKVS